MSRTLQTAVSHVSHQKRLVCLATGVLFCLVLVFVWGERAGAAGGDLDTSFNSGGAGAGDTVYAVALQPDGKSIIGGYFTSYNGNAAASDKIARLNTDGTLDATFNNGGAGADNTVYAVAVQSDGKILIAGDFTSYNGDGAASDKIARLNTDGTLDTTFNNGGAGADDTMFAVAVQSDGKILIGGDFTSYNGDTGVSDYIARLNTDGTLDATFNNGGAGADTTVNVVALQANGKILIGGSFTGYNGGDANDYVARLNTDGMLDTSFNMGGSGMSFTVNTVAVQPDGKIISGGSFTSYNGNASDYIARLNADGTLDTSFNAGGVGTDGTVYAVAVQPDGKILIGGFLQSYNGDADASDKIARLNTDGTLDTSFNYGGAGAGAGNQVFAVAVQSDGKIIIGGDFTSYNGDTAASDRVARLLPAPGELAFSVASQSVNESAGNATITLTRTGGTDNQVVAKVTLADVTTSAADYTFKPGSADASFNTGMGADNEVWSVAAQPDGKILIGGKFLNYNGTARTRIARLNADGTLDTSFNPGAGANDIVYAIAIQPDGRILIGGAFTDYDGTARSRIARLNSDGTLDTTFNPGAGAAGTVPDVRTILLQPDGKAIIGGNFTMYDGTARGRIARLNSDASLDTSFATGAGATGGGVFALALYSDGKVFIGGAFTMYDGTARGRVARINSDGTLDTSFAPSTGAEGSGINVWAVAIQPDGGVLIGGNFTIYNGTARGRIVRANADGSLDATFNPGTGANSVVWTTTIQPDGKIIVCGAFSAFNGTTRNRILRLNSNGSLDTTFNPGTGANAVILSATALQPDGRIAFGGQFTTFNGATSNRVARVNGDLFVTWPAGDATDKTIQLPIVNDGLNGEADESLNLSLAVMSGGATLGSPNTVTLTILDPNDAPLNTVPAAQTTNEDTTKVFSAANGNQISISDADAGANAVRVTLTATHGTVTLSGTSGLSFITGDGTSDATMIFTGTVTNLNAALNGLSFAPAANYGGAATLQIVSNDQGNTGTGGAQSDTDTVNLTVTPIADTPTVTNATTAENTKTTSGLVISRGAGDTATTTHFKITAITNGTLFQNNGTTVISNNQFITFAQGNAGLKFLPTAGLSSPSSSFSFKVQASTSAVDAGLGGSIATATITVTEGGVLKFSAATYSVSEGDAHDDHHRHAHGRQRRRDHRQVRHLQRHGHGLHLLRRRQGLRHQDWHTLLGRGRHGEQDLHHPHLQRHSLRGQRDRQPRAQQRDGQRQPRRSTDCRADDCGQRDAAQALRQQRDGDGRQLGNTQRRLHSNFVRRERADGDGQVRHGQRDGRRACGLHGRAFNDAHLHAGAT